MDVSSYGWSRPAGRAKILKSQLKCKHANEAARQNSFHNQFSLVQENCVSTLCDVRKSVVSCSQERYTSVSSIAIVSILCVSGFFQSC